MAACCCVPPILAHPCTKSDACSNEVVDCLAAANVKAELLQFLCISHSWLLIAMARSWLCCEPEFALLPCPAPPPALQVLVQAGAYVKDDACRHLILLVVNAAQLHGYAVRSSYRALAASLDKAQPSLLMVATWCLGEAWLVEGVGG